jgi:hypothetical protein
MKSLVLLLSILFLVYSEPKIDGCTGASMDFPLIDH